MYQGVIKEKRIIFLRQVDDFAVASKQAKTCQEFLEKHEQTTTNSTEDFGNHQQVQWK
jgi:hypothetical protein